MLAYRARVGGAPPHRPRSSALDCARARVLVRLIVGAALIASVAACEDDRDPPPPPSQDFALECLPPGTDAGPTMDGGRVLGCAGSEVCIQGRCYPACEDDADCGPREMCAASGACVARSGPERDGGPLAEQDAGPTGACAGVTCEGNLVCHPLAGQCVQCNEDSITAPLGEPGSCPNRSPICDIANGRCVPLEAAQCAPCTVDSDCEAIDPDGFQGRCVLREVMDVREQVCMRPCAETDPACPPGLTCDPDEQVCVPAAGLTCTTWVAGTRGDSCLFDAECNPLGASAAFYPGTCEGEILPTMPDGGPGTDAGPPADGGPPADAAPASPDGGGLDASTPVEDGGAGIPGNCLQPCGMDEDCADTSLQCLGSGSALFCQEPPPGDAGVPAPSDGGLTP